MQDHSDNAFRYRRLYSKYPMLEAEVVFACRQEYACTAVDVLARRTRLAFLDSKAAELVRMLCEVRFGQDDAHRHGGLLRDAN